MLIKQTRKPLVVLLVALKQHGNHGSTLRDWPLQRKWKSRRQDLKIPWVNKEVILPNLLLKTSWDKNLFLCWGSMLIYSRRSLYVTLLSLLPEPQKKDLVEENCLEDQRLLLLPWGKSGLRPALQQRVQLKTSSAKHWLCITFSYGFTWLESKYFCWHFATFIKELLKINSLSKGSVVKLHTGICCHRIQRRSFYLLNCRGAHLATSEALLWIRPQFNAG